MSDTNIIASTALNSTSDNELFLAFVDAIGKPVADLKVKIMSNGVPLELHTDHQGALPIIHFGIEVGSATVSAFLPTGAEEVVLGVQIGKGLQCFTCRSPYVLLNGQTRVHEGRSTLDEKPEIKSTGDIKDKRSIKGNPVRECTVMDCPNDENLRLCPNQQYKSHILTASKSSNIIPQAIAALINTEAGRQRKTIEKPVLNKKGQPVVGKSGKPKIRKVTIDTLEWAEDSQNPRSTARGLTQFLKGTWLGQALDTSTYLHSEAVKRGHVKKETKQVIVSKAKKDKPAVTKEKNSYEIKQQDKLLDMRLEPEFAIMAAVDYGMQNLRGLNIAGFSTTELNDSDKAKLFYLTHHLGLTDAIRFIQNEIEEEDKEVTRKNGKNITIAGAETLLIAQVGDTEAEKYAEKEGGSYIQGHRRWLIDFIDKKIAPQNFACDKSKIPEGSKLYELISDLGGSHPDGFTKSLSN